LRGSSKTEDARENVTFLPLWNGRPARAELNVVGEMNCLRRALTTLEAAT
jgi:hypothetical protein